MSLEEASARQAALELRELVQPLGLRIIYIRKCRTPSIEVPVYDGNGRVRIDARSKYKRVPWFSVFSNAAHEVGHWLLADKSRLLVDYGAYFGDRPWNPSKKSPAICATRVTFGSMAMPSS